MSKKMTASIMAALFIAVTSTMIFFLMALALDHTGTFLTLIMYAIGYNVSKALYTATGTLYEDIKRGDKE